MKQLSTTEPSRRAELDGDYVEFWPAGTAAKGDFECTVCGNRVRVRHVLPRCMLCGMALWERPQPTVVDRPST
jgi:hypothetical protein